LRQTQFQASHAVLQQTLARMRGGSAPRLRAEDLLGENRAETLRYCFPIARLEVAAQRFGIRPRRTESRSSVVLREQKAGAKALSSRKQRAPSFCPTGTAANDGIALAVLASSFLLRNNSNNWLIRKQSPHLLGSWIKCVGAAQLESICQRKSIIFLLSTLLMPLQPVVLDPAYADHEYRDEPATRGRDGNRRRRLDRSSVLGVASYLKRHWSPRWS
jgi:hypothetical protein